MRKLILAGIVLSLFSVKSACANSADGDVASKNFATIQAQIQQQQQQTQAQIQQLQTNLQQQMATLNTQLQGQISQVQKQLQGQIQQLQQQINKLGQAKG